MKALRPPPAASPVTYLFRFRCPHDSSLLRVRCYQRSRAGEGPAPGQDHCSAGDPIAGSLSRGREWNISDCMSVSTNEATHPRCNVEGCPDRPGRASYMEGEP